MTKFLNIEHGNLLYSSGVPDVATERLYLRWISTGSGRSHLATHRAGKPDETQQNGQLVRFKFDVSYHNRPA